MKSRLFILVTLALGTTALSSPQFEFPTPAASVCPLASPLTTNPHF